MATCGGALLFAAACGSDTATAAAHATHVPSPPSIKFSFSPPADTASPTPVAAMTTTAAATSAAPPVYSSPTADVPKQCRYITLDEMGQVTNPDITWATSANSTDECYYTADITLLDSIEVVVDPPDSLGTPTDATSVSGLGYPATWSTQYGALVVRMPKHDFAIFFTGAPDYMNESASELKAQAIKAFKFAKPRLT